MFVISGEDNILRGGRLFVAEARAAIYVHLVIDGKYVLGNRIRDAHRCASLGRRMVDQIIIGNRNIFLQLVSGNLRLFADGNRAVFRNIQQAAQTVAGNGAAEMILQRVGLRVFVPFVVHIVISSGGNGIPRAHMNPVGGDFCAIRHRSIGGSINSVVYTGAAHADDAAVTFLGGEARLILLGRHNIDFPCGLPLAAEGAAHGIGGFVIYMGAHVAHQSAAACVGQGFARILAIGRNQQISQLIRHISFPREGGFQGFCTADVRAGIAHRHAADGDVIDIRLAIHIGFVVQNEVGILAKGAVLHIDRARSSGVQNDRVRSDRPDGDVVPFHVAFQGAAIGITKHGSEFHSLCVEIAASYADLRAHVHDALAPHPADTENRDGHVARAELRRGIVGRAQMELIGRECAVRSRDFGRSFPFDDIPVFVFFPVLDSGMVHRHVDAADTYALGMSFQRIGFLRVNGNIIGSRNGILPVQCDTHIAVVFHAGKGGRNV